MNLIIEAMARAHHEEAQKWRIVGIPGSPWYAEREGGRLLYAQSREDAMDVSRHACMRAAVRAAMECQPTILMYERWLDNTSDPLYSREGMVADWRALLGAVVEE